MREFSELVEYCVANGHYLAFNYSPFDGTYQVYVNPGRAMTSAKRHKTLQDAVRMCWVALGVNPKYEWVDANEKTDRKNDVAELNANRIMGVTTAVIAPKKRGRPKGSKNRPKEVLTAYENPTKSKEIG